MCWKSNQKPPKKGPLSKPHKTPLIFLLKPLKNLQNPLNLPLYMLQKGLIPPKFTQKWEFAPKNGNRDPGHNFRLRETFQREFITKTKLIRKIPFKNRRNRNRVKFWEKNVLQTEANWLKRWLKRAEKRGDFEAF